MTTVYHINKQFTKTCLTLPQRTGRPSAVASHAEICDAELLGFTSVPQYLPSLILQIVVSLIDALVALSSAAARLKALLGVKTNYYLC